MNFTSTLIGGPEKGRWGRSHFTVLKWAVSTMTLFVQVFQATTFLAEFAHNKFVNISRFQILD